MIRYLVAISIDETRSLQRSSHHGVSYELKFTMKHSISLATLLVTNATTELPCASLLTVAHTEAAVITSVVTMTRTHRHRAYYALDHSDTCVYDKSGTFTNLDISTVELAAIYWCCE